MAKMYQIYNTHIYIYITNIQQIYNKRIATI